MSNYLSKDIMRNWTPEQKEEYRQSLCQRMADISIFLAQITEVIEEQNG
jgi:hypothetical protein